MSSVETLAYFLEEDSLRGVMRDWPEGMQLLVCLDETGRCDLIVHHGEESARVLETLRLGLGLAPDELAVVPEVEGYATRRTRFSQEQQLLALAAATEGLGESAQDYAINYRFAREEGLDPELVVGKRALRRASDEAEAAALPRVAERPGSRRSLPAEPRQFPEGYAPASDPERRDGRIVEGRIHGQGGRVRVEIAPGAPGADKPVTVDQVGLSEDLGRFALPRETLEHWRPGRSLQIDIPQDRFPEALAEMFRHEAHAAQITVTPRAVFVRPLGPVPPEAAEPDEAPMVEVAEGWAPGRAMRAALIAVGVVLVSGSLAAAWNPFATPEEHAVTAAPPQQGLAALAAGAAEARP
ncbi:hypothetical protein [Limimaricola pyoseonensis]|uniref:Uncharacterized protein n=1 Tax=Limimaricola pyoseonensis TaxID=521013 RepID=A0A1G7K9T8_9RHOB|nr:hypothetical protein [Limimaricola pyoseonensis]SDF34003.1 hypothetical protein SAMN04488567_0139 [Limimaricola pyoseonensis]